MAIASSGRLMNALQLFPIDASCSSSLLLVELIPTVVLEPLFQSNSFREDVERQQTYEQVQERLRQQVEEKYSYLFLFISYQKKDISYPHAIRLYHEISSQMYKRYHEKQMTMEKNIEELVAFEMMMAEDQADIIMTFTEMEQEIHTMLKMIKNKLYMKHKFMDMWMITYPDTDKKVLEEELDMSECAFMRMSCQSPKYSHLDKIDAMYVYKVDSVEEWFVTMEQYKNDMITCPELMVSSPLDRLW